MIGLIAAGNLFVVFAVDQIPLIRNFFDRFFQLLSKFVILEMSIE